MNKSSAREKSISKDVTHVNEESKELHKRLTIDHITQIKNCFYATPDQRLEKNQFRKLLWDIDKISYNDEEFDILYLKIDSGTTLTHVTWYCFLLHIIMGFQADETEKYSSLLEPPVKDIEKVIKSTHRHPIIKITFVPDVLPNRNVNNLSGSYVTGSKDGVINFWSIELEKERTVSSQPYTLKTVPTWVIDLVSLPDVNIICVSSTERELRFYDTSANKFDLRIVITSLEDFASTLYYTFYADATKESKLIYGDIAGRVRLIEFKPENRGPFRGETRQNVISMKYDEFVKGGVPMMRVKEIPTKHTDYVQQVAYFEIIHCIISISFCSEQSMLIYSTKTKDFVYSFKVAKGFSCFAMASNLQVIVTGGRDCSIRLWNPFVTERATSTLRGHHTEIVSLAVQEEDNMLCSMDNERYLKVWDMVEQCCLQTFLGLHSIMQTYLPVSTYYNPESRQLFIADLNITVLRVFPLLNGEFTDGISHSKEVSVILYNKLFQVIVTCGYDSIIIVWDPYIGRRQKVIRNAHMKSMQGETMPVEITAAAFDPTSKLLISGASDGTLKVWNFNTGTCYRNMNIQRGCEVCAIIWLKYRILVTGENRVVTEFADGEDASYSSFKNWSSRHEDDILCAAANLPQALVTASASGEIVFWRLETGQPYGMYNVLYPRERIQLQYNIEKRKHVRTPIQVSKRSSLAQGIRVPSHKTGTTGMSKMQQSKKYETSHRYDSSKLPVHALLFLTTRRTEPTIGSLLVSLENGMIQLWSHHAGGGFLCSFKATHSSKDYIITMNSDEKNHYLFTGHMGGYIKLWHIINYGQNEADHVRVNMPQMRLKFPFLLKDLIPGRAKRAAELHGPLLLSSIRGHLKPVTAFAYLDKTEVLISSDKTARLWTLTGRYLGTLGTFKPWTYITPNVPVSEERTFYLPADIQRTASFTTRKVLLGGVMKDPLAKEEEEEQIDLSHLDTRTIDFDHILGHHFKIPRASVEYPSIKEGEGDIQISPYSQVMLYDIEDVQRSSTPDLIKQIRAQNVTFSKKSPR